MALIPDNKRTHFENIMKEMKCLLKVILFDEGKDTLDNKKEKDMSKTKKVEIS